MATGLLIVAAWAFAEAVLWFVVADVPVMAVALRHGVRSGFVAALLAGLFAMLGGLATYLWAAADPEGAWAMITMLPGIDTSLADNAARSWHQEGVAAMLEGSFSGVPYKLYALAAGAAGDPVAPFMAASLAARLPRFLLVAIAAGIIGPPLRQRIGNRTTWLAFGAAWIAFYAWYFAAMATGKS